jgi:hypothetical protein
MTRMDPAPVISVRDLPKERMTVGEINPLLYSPNHARDRLEHALRIDRFHPDGARRLKRYSRAQRLRLGAVTRGSCRSQLHIRLHQDFDRSRSRRSIRSPRTSSR